MLSGEHMLHRLPNINFTQHFKKIVTIHQLWIVIGNFNETMNCAPRFNFSVLDLRIVNSSTTSNLMHLCRMMIYD